LQEIQLHQYQELLVKACTTFPYAYYERYIPQRILRTLSGPRVLVYTYAGGQIIL
jgi:dTDP-D-glucose 4,6-dehydratase